MALSLLAASVAAAGTTTEAIAGQKNDHGRGDGAARPASYTLPGDAVFPEGIAREPGSKTFFVTSTSDGTVFRGDLRSPELAAFAPPGADGRTTAVGLKADRRGNLVVAGGATGKVFALSTRDGATRKVLDTQPNGAATFLNDVAISRGFAYITDSKRPFLYRVALRGDAVGEIEPFLTYPPSFVTDPAVNNANGIAIDRAGRYAIVVQSNTGKLFRVDLRTREVAEVDLGGASVPSGDGLLLDGRTLYVARNAAELIVPVRLTRQGRRGVVGTGVTGPQLKFPTTLAQDGDRLLAVNAQFDKRGSGQPPELPFDVATIAAPPAPRPNG